MLLDYHDSMIQLHRGSIRSIRVQQHLAKRSLHLIRRTLSTDRSGPLFDHRCVSLSTDNCAPRLPAFNRLDRSGEHLRFGTQFAKILAFATSKSLSTSRVSTIESRIYVRVTLIPESKGNQRGNSRESGLKFATVRFSRRTRAHRKPPRVRLEGIQRSLPAVLTVLKQGNRG